MKFMLQALVDKRSLQSVVCLLRGGLAVSRQADIRLARRLFFVAGFFPTLKMSSAAAVFTGLFAFLTVASAQTLTAAGNLAEVSIRHTATLLADGRVLLVKTDGHAMRFDPASNQWSTVIGPSIASTDATATRLPYGTVLFAGGHNGGGIALSRAERCSPTSGVWSTALAMATARTFHTATLMADGSALMVGGSPQNSIYSAAHTSVERYDPAAGTWAAGPDLPAGRTQHSATRNANGDVIVLGGFVAGAASNACVRLPQGGANWLPCAAMTKVRAGHRATLLADGRIFVSGGATAATGYEEIYAPTTDTWVDTSLAARTATNHVVVELNPGVLMIWGGAPWFFYTPGSDPAPQVQGAVTYAIASGSVTMLSAFPARAGHAATPLADGRVLVSGGFAAYSSSTSLGTFYDPIPLAASYTTPLERLSTTLQFSARSGGLPAAPVAGESYSVYAAVSSANAGGLPPDGTLVVSNGTSSCRITLPAASCRLIAATAGSQSYSVSYLGSPIYAPQTITSSVFPADLLRIQRVGDVVGTLTSSTGGAFGFASCGASIGPIPDQCDLTPAPGAAIMLTIQPRAAGISFVGWQGACAASATTCSLTMPASGSLAVKAHFVATPKLPLTLDIDGNGSIGVATDGALLLRFLRRLHGAALTASVLGVSPTRSDVDAIEDRFDTMAPLLDVDQNGTVDAATDGVIILRYLLGFRGSALTLNATGQGARRTDPQLIAADLALLTP